MEAICGVLEQNPGGLTAEQIAERGNFSGRTVVSRGLKELIEKGKAISVRQGRNIFYFYGRVE